MTVDKVRVELFKPNGKWYTDEEWRIPEIVTDWSERRGDFTRAPIVPSDMRQSPDFRRISGGHVLIPAQEPWGFAALIPAEPEPRDEWTGQLAGGPNDGNLVTASVERFRCEVTTRSWLDGRDGQVAEWTVKGHYVWHEPSGTFGWQLERSL